MCLNKKKRKSIINIEPISTSIITPCHINNNKKLHDLEITIDQVIKQLNNHFEFKIKTGIEKPDKIIEKNRRIGVSLSGIPQFFSYIDCDMTKFISWLSICYYDLEKYDEKISHIFGINKSIKKTCVKPSGTLSLMIGALPSVTFPYYRKYIRRVRVNENDSLIEKYEKLGYKIEQDVVNPNTKIINFIINLDNCVILNDENIENDLCIASILQTFWADQSVSMTIQFDPNIDDNEFNEIINKYSKTLKTIGFLPKQL